MTKDTERIERLEADVQDAKIVLDQAIKAKFDAEDWAQKCQVSYFELVTELQVAKGNQ